MSAETPTHQPEEIERAIARSGSTPKVLDSEGYSIASEAENLYGAYGRAAKEEDEYTEKLEENDRQLNVARAIGNSIIEVADPEVRPAIKEAAVASRIPLRDERNKYYDRVHKSSGDRKIAFVDAKEHYDDNRVAYVVDAVEDARGKGYEINIDPNHPANEFIQVPNPGEAPVGPEQQPPQG